MRNTHRKILIALSTLTLGMLGGIAGNQPGPTDAPVMEVAEQPTKLTNSLRSLIAEDAGPHRVWVFFADKGVDSQNEYRNAIAKVEATYNKRAIERRRLRADNAARGGALFDFNDLPVVKQYADAVGKTGAHVRIQSKWLNAVSAIADADQIREIAALPFVAKMQPVARSRGVDPIDVRRDENPGSPASPLLSLNYGRSTEQLNQINLIALHDAGYTGQDVIIGILDTGFQRSHEAFNQPGHEVNVIAEYDFVDDDSDTSAESGDPSSQHRHGTYILGCLGSYKSGDLIGGAFDASFVLAKTEDTSDEYPAEEDNYVAGLEFIEANGGDMFTSSLGYIDWYSQSDLDGETAVTTIAVNITTGNGVHGCTAAGNESHDDNPSTSHLIAPSDAFQVITCGAVDSGGDMASFSSDGPSADGRVKPELLARGVSTHTVDPDYDTDYTTVGGTSLSTPLVACAVGCLVSAHPDWTPDEMRDAMFNTAAYFAEHGTYEPLYVRGYGIVNALDASQGISFSFPDGLPTMIEAGADTTFAVTISENYDGPIETGSEILFHRKAGASTFSPESMTHLGGSAYEATIPAYPSGSLVEFYLEVQTTGGTFYRAPIDAPADLYEAGAVGLYYVYDMETDPGWTTEGLWDFGQPTGGGGEYGFSDPTIGFTGSNVYGYNLYGDYENDLPEKHLTSLPIDCSELTNVTLRFYRWLGVEQPDYDHAYVLVSNDGFTWTTVWENAVEVTDSSWSLLEYKSKSNYI